jgi:FtsP/CotA-like multicopper oxidase with cupredoxin domain
VRIILRNEVPEPTSIHWRGFEPPFSQDGASGYHSFEARRPVMPGQTEMYEFDLIQSGTLMYHTGFNVMKQEALGLSGAFVIHPRRRERNLDKDSTLVLQQWTFQPGNLIPNINSMEPSFATYNGKTVPSFPQLVVD